MRHRCTSHTQYFIHNTAPIASHIVVLRNNIEFSSTCWDGGVMHKLGDGAMLGGGFQKKQGIYFQITHVGICIHFSIYMILMIMIISIYTAHTKKTLHIASLSAR